MKHTKRSNYHDVITRTIYLYYVERFKELTQLTRSYNQCTDLKVRRYIRARKEELVSILSKNVHYAKASVAYILGISYKEVSTYPDLIQVTLKKQYLLNSIK